MLRTEAGGGAAAGGGAPSSGAAGGGGLRSASPHRNAYEATIQALAPTKEADGEDGKKSRGKKYGSNVHRIKNMFLQMGTAPGPEGACDLAKAKEKPVRLSLPRASSLGDSVDQGSLLKLGTSVSERVSRFDSKPDKPFSKLQETRKIFERSPQEKASTTRLLLRKERAGFQDRKLDVVVRFNGSTESLDKLDAEAVSPTVSQLSAVFEKADLRNNLHKAPGRAGAPLAAKAVGKRPRVFLPSAEAGRPGEGHAAPARARPPDEEKAAGRGGRPADKEAAAPRVQEVCKIKPVEVEESGEAEEEEAAAAGEPVPVTQPAKGAEGPVPSTPRLDGGSAAAAGEDVKGERAEEGDGYEEAKKEDFSEADLVDISAYSGLGEDSGGSGLEEEEEAEGLYEPESGCVEIPGLSEEDEPVPNRKIQFSTAPIQVSPPRKVAPPSEGHPRGRCVTPKPSPFGGLAVGTGRWGAPCPLQGPWHPWAMPLHGGGHPGLANEPANEGPCPSMAGPPGTRVTGRVALGATAVPGTGRDTPQVLGGDARNPQPWGAGAADARPPAAPAPGVPGYRSPPAGGPWGQGGGAGGVCPHGPGRVPRTVSGSA